MSPAELRSMVADLEDSTPTVMPDGRMRNLRGPQWRPAGVHRRGQTRSVRPGGGPGGVVLADVAWFETVTEWFERSPSP